MTRTVRTTIIAALALVALFLAAAPASAAGKNNCNISGKEQKLGASYATSVKTKRVGCKKALRVVKAFHRCRKENGGSDGKCKGRVKGFKCKEKREGVPNIQYNAKVKCRKGQRRIWHTYTQNV